MSTTLRVALSQANVTVGDLRGNAARMAEGLRHAQAWLADVVVFPELAITGYPPEDLLLKPQFIQDNVEALRSLVPATRGITAIIGFVDRDPHGALHNAAAIMANGRHVATYDKQYLPNYGVFDEKRYFTPGTEPMVLACGAARVGMTICEDLWESAPCRTLARAGCQAVINISASPYHAGKVRVRERLFGARARTNRLAVAYCNLIGGQDELVFDGASVCLSAGGRVVARGAQFQEDLVLVDLPCGTPRQVASKARVVRLPFVSRSRPTLPAMSRPCLPPLEEVYEALVLGTRDYVRKNGFQTVVLGLSGGIDSSLTACLAVDALGPAHVVGVVMPSRFSSRATQTDAKRLAARLGIRRETISIEPVFSAYLKTLASPFAGRPSDVTEQNLQARIRGNLLMALSNKFGWLVLTTGNKSEMATGYTTLYGDMAGGLAVIKDVPKTLVYQLARLRNRRGSGGPIPTSVLRRVPTAELAPHQTDQDTLPPYDVLDRLITGYVEEDRHLEEIVRRERVSPTMVARVIQMVDRSEYKRRQGPPGIKITPKAFGKDRRMPITNRYAHS